MSGAQSPQLGNAPTSLPGVASRWLAFACACLAPVALGSTHALAIVALIGGLSLALGIGIGTATRPAAIVIGATAGLIALFPLIYILQVWVGPTSQPLRTLTELAQQALTAESPLTVTLHRDPFDALAMPLLYGLALSCGVLIGSQVRSARQFQTRFAWFVAIYAAFTLLLFIETPNRVLWLVKRSHQTDFTATFLNRNTAAIFIGMGLICLAGVLSRALRKRQQIRAGQSRSTFRVKRTLFFGVVATVIASIALLLTNSRAGTALTFAAVMLVFLLAQSERRLRMHRATIALVAFALAVATPLTIGLLDLRISSRLSDGGGRLDAYLSTMSMIRDNPWLGVGLGNYAESIPVWRLPSQTSWGVWTRAHNVGLELAAEAGLPFASVLIVAWIAIGAVLARSALRARRPLTAVPLAVYLLGTAHSLIDFSIQIPGAGVVFYMLVGCGVGLSFALTSENRLPAATGSQPASAS